MHHYGEKCPGRPSLSSSLHAVACVVVLMFSGPLAAAESQYSGFLGPDGNYERLEKVELKSGQKAMRWLGPTLNIANYKSVLLDPVQFYPEPQAGPQVSEETLEQVKTYLSEQLHDRIGGVFKISDEPREGVVRIQVAVTGVLIKTQGVQAYEILPIAAVFGGVKAATGKREKDVKVLVEIRLDDSVSGELLGMVVREIEGRSLKGKKDSLKLEHLQENLDTTAVDASEGIAASIRQ